MKPISLLLFLAFVVTLTGCHSLRNGKIRYKKVQRADRVTEKVASVSAEDSQEEFLEYVSDKSAIKEQGNSEVEPILETQDTEEFQLEDKSGQPEIPSIVHRSRQKSEVSDTSPKRDKESFKNDETEQQKARRKRKRNEKIVEGAFVALAILSLVAMTGIFGEVVAIIGFVVGGAMLLTILIVIIYNFAQGS